MSPRSDPDHVVYRSRSQAAAIAACGVVVLIAAIAGLVGTWGTDRFTGMIAIAAVAALIGAFLVLRVGRTALYAGRGGVRIANVWSTHVLGWKDIAAFTKRPYGPAKVTTVDHRTIDVFAIQQSNWANMRGKTDTPADAMVAELNARLAANRIPTRQAPLRET
jgi:hypothetical protein